MVEEYGYHCEYMDESKSILEEIIPADLTQNFESDSEISDIEFVLRQNAKIFSNT